MHHVCRRCVLVVRVAEAYDFLFRHKTRKYYATTY